MAYSDRSAVLSVPDLASWDSYAV